MQDAYDLVVVLIDWCQVWRNRQRRVAPNRSGSPSHPPVAAEGPERVGNLHDGPGVSDYRQTPPSDGCRGISVFEQEGWCPGLFRDVDSESSKTGRAGGLYDSQLRHTHATRLIQNGLSLYEVRSVLGHSDIKTTMRYAHLEQAVVTSKARDAIDRLNASNCIQLGKVTENR